MNIKNTCPFGHKCESMIDSDTMERCTFYIQIRGKDPQSEEIIDKWGCAIGWLPILLIENAQMVRGTGAAIESLRNEVVKNNVQQLYSLTHSHVPLPLNIADESTP